MALTPSTLAMPLGAPAPAFTLPSTNGHGDVTLRALAQGKRATLVAFICNHCPYVVHLKPDLAAFARELAAQDVAVVAISSNDAAAYPQDGPEAMARDAEAQGYVFPYCFDATQDVAHAYGAACTPDFFLFDEDLRLAYRGRFDASRPGNDLPVTGADLRAAVAAVLAGEPAPSEPLPSLGCNIKWKPGGAPGCPG